MYVSSCQSVDLRIDIVKYEEGAFKPGGALGYFLGGYVLPGTPNWHPVLKKIPPIPRSRNGPIFYTLFLQKRCFFICSTYTSNKCFFIISNNFTQKIKP